MPPPNMEVRRRKSSLQRGPGQIRPVARTTPAQIQSVGRTAPGQIRPVGRTTPNRKSTSALPAMDRASMLVMEANEIAACLGKDYSFTKEASLGEAADIRVTHTSWKISTVWSIDKLKERLVHMRKFMYSASSDNMEMEAVFFDPSDNWSKVGCERSASPDSPLKSPPTSRNMILLPENKPEKVSPRNGIMGETLRDMRSQNGKQSPRSTSFNISSMNKRNVKGKRDNLTRPRASTFGPDNHCNGEGDPCSSVDTDAEEAHPIHENGSSHPAIATRLVNGHGLSKNSSVESMFVLDCSEPCNTAPIQHEELGDYSNNILRDEIVSESESDVDQYAKPVYSHTYSDHTKATSAITAAGSPMERSSSSLTSSSSQTDIVLTPASALTHCKRYLAVSRERLKYTGEDTVVDKILTNCENLKVASLNVYESFIESQDRAGDTAAFAESDTVKLSSLQLATSAQLLSSHVDLWCAGQEAAESATLLRDLQQALKDAVADVIQELTQFLEFCDSGNDVSVSDSAGHLIDLLHIVCQQSGQLALATNVTPNVCSAVPGKETHFYSKDSMVIAKVGPDLQKAFLEGVDSFLRQSFCSAQQTLDMTSATAAQSAIGADPGGVGDHICAALMGGIVLVKQCEMLQDEVVVELQDNQEKSADYVREYYCRALSLRKQVPHLANNTSVLHTAYSHLRIDPQGGNLRKLCRCADILHLATSKVLVAAGCKTPTECNANFDERLSMFSPINEPEYQLVVNEPQCESVERAGMSLQRGLRALQDCLKDLLALDNGSSDDQPCRRMLPATPGTTLRGLVRCQSARQADHTPVRRRDRSRTRNIVSPRNEH